MRKGTKQENGLEFFSTRLPVGLCAALRKRSKETGLKMQAQVAQLLMKALAQEATGKTNETRQTGN